MKIPIFSVILGLVILLTAAIFVSPSLAPISVKSSTGENLQELNLTRPQVQGKSTDTTSHETLQLVPDSENSKFRPSPQPDSNFTAEIEAELQQIENLLNEYDYNYLGEDFDLE